MAFVDRLSQLGAATIHEAVGPGSACDPGLLPMWPGAVVCGPAFTVRGRTGDNLAIHHALQRVQKGDVLVIQLDGHLAGYWGAVLTVAAIETGCSGLVIDGGIRDLAEIRAKQFPVFARGRALVGTGKHHPGELNVPVVVGGVRVEPGDYIIGDDDGVAVVPSSGIETALAQGERRNARELELMEKLRGGSDTVALLGLATRDQ